MEKILKNQQASKHITFNNEKSVWISIDNAGFEYIQSWIHKTLAKQCPENSQEVLMPENTVGRIILMRKL